jgi:hypothetical protein
LISRQDILPKRLSNCYVLQCAACPHGNTPKGSWHVERAPRDCGLFHATRAGQIVNQSHPPKRLANFCVPPCAACPVISRVPQCDACHSGKASAVVCCKQGMAYWVIIHVPQYDSDKTAVVPPCMQASAVVCCKQSFLSKRLVNFCALQGAGLPGRLLPLACRTSCVPQHTASKSPCHVKGIPKNGNLLQATVAGLVAFINQLEPTVPKVAGRIKGRLHVQLGHVATVYVHGYDQLSFLYRPILGTAKRAVTDKQAFVAYTVADQGQTPSFYSINVHFTSGTLEHHIRKLPKDARTSLSHINHCMKDANQQRTVSVCGVNDHYRLGVAEHGIRKIQEGSETSHTKHHPHMGRTIDSSSRHV